jgi:hypothetical protein
MACASVSDRRRQQALLQGALVTCPICTDDDILPELMVCCNRDSSPHYYCIACTKHHAELSIANGIYVYFDINRKYCIQASIRFVVYRMNATIN